MFSWISDFPRWSGWRSPPRGTVKRFSNSNRMAVWPTQQGSHLLAVILELVHFYVQVAPT